MPCNKMSNSDALALGPRNRGRKYLNREERGRFLSVVATTRTHHRLFVETLAWTGGRISEVMAITPNSFDITGGTLTLQTLKRRRHVVREVPIPPALIDGLVVHFDLAAAQRDPVRAAAPLWNFCRVTGWRIVKRLMHEAQLSGAPATPRGLRHAFGVGTLQAGIPITLLQRWLGHARLTTTAIYSEVVGPEELEFAARFWSWGSAPVANFRPRA